jgi:hypothetical protein
MATVDKNFRIKNGLVVEGSTATVNGSNILTENSLEFIQDTVAAQLVDGTHTNISVSYNDTTGTISLTGAVTYTDEQAQDAVGNAVGTGLSYNDTTGAISVDTATIQARVADVSDTEIGYLNGVTSSIQTQLNDKASSSDLTTHTGATEAHGATGAVVGTTNTQTLTNKTLTSPVINTPTGITKTDVGLANVDNTSDANKPVSSATQTALDAKLALSGGTMTGAIEMGTSKITGLGAPTNANDAATKTYVDGVITNLVDGAPDLLNTLNELAAAINDDANYTTTITTALGTKAPLASPDLTGVPTAPTAAANTDTTQIATTAFAKAEADAAQSAAEATASGDATSKANAAQAAAEATASSALSGATAGTTAFTAVNVNSVAKQIAATTGNIVTAAATTAYSWAKASYRSGEFLVKSKNGNHTEVAKIMVTLDASDNVYITEYGMSSTSGVALQTVSADVSGTDVRIRVTPANNNTEVLITGILLV